MKKIGTSLIVVFLLLLLSLSVGYYWWQQNSLPVSSSDAKLDFLITRGKGASQIAQDLYSQKLIKNPLAFKVYVQVMDLSDKIQAGRYSLSSDLSLVKVVNILVEGPKDIWVTIPEGLRREEIVERFIQDLEKSAKDGDIFRQEFLKATEEKEGFLFPDTYLFPKEVSASVAVTTMNNTFNKRIDEAGGISNSRLSQEEIVIIASIIERETKTNEERPAVAGILLNRLNIGMGLQADATVQYAVASLKCKAQGAKCDNWWPVVTRSDLLIDSPFNTYKYEGLPPSPIANPGLSSLKAVLLPKSSNYLYYLHDSEGQIHYAEDLNKHNQNIRQFLSK